MDQDLVTIGMPVYNGERYLESAIRSNLAQTYSNIELIISDNASTDGTEDICRKFAAMDSRIVYLRNSNNIGAAGNYNFLVERARGKFFRWANADDLISPDLIMTLLPLLSSREDAVIAFGRTRLIGAGDEELGDYDDDVELQADRPSERYAEFYRRSGLTNVIYGLMRIEAMRSTNLMGSGDLPAGDVSFLAAMSMQGKFINVPATLFYRRMHDGAFSANPDPEAQAQFWSASSRKTMLGNWRAFRADGFAIARMNTSFSEKLRLLRYWSKRMVWQRRTLIQELREIF